MPTGTGGRDGASLQVSSGIDHNDAAFLQDVSRVNENCLGRQDKLTAAKKTSTRNCVRAPTRLLPHSMQLTERVRNNAGRDAANRPEPRHHSLMVRRRNHQWCGGGDSNPGTPTGQGPKPSALTCSAPLTWPRPFKSN